MKKIIMMCLIFTLVGCQTMPRVYKENPNTTNYAAAGCLIGIILALQYDSSQAKACVAFATAGFIGGKKVDKQLKEYYHEQTELSDVKPE